MALPVPVSDRRPCGLMTRRRSLDGPQGLGWTCMGGWVFLKICSGGLRSGVASGSGSAADPPPPVVPRGLRQLEWFRYGRPASTIGLGQGEGVTISLSLRILGTDPLTGSFAAGRGCGWAGAGLWEGFPGQTGWLGCGRGSWAEGRTGAGCWVEGRTGEGSWAEI